MQPLSIERDVRRNGIRMDCVFEGMAFDAAREQVRTLRLSGTKLSQIAEQTGMPVEQVMDYCRELGIAGNRKLPSGAAGPSERTQMSSLWKNHRAEWKRCAEKILFG